MAQFHYSSCFTQRDNFTSICDSYAEIRLREGYTSVQVFTSSAYIRYG